ncbi:endo alpha-1,4 polygalactosaminidase [Bacteroidota bacterium]
MRLQRINRGIIVALGILLTGSISCKKSEDADIDYRQEMRSFIQHISVYARGYTPGFIVVPQNGQELITQNGESSGPLATTYLQTISGQAREDLFYGYYGDGLLTPSNELHYLQGYLDRIKTEGKSVLVTDYCSSHPDMLDSYQKNTAKGYISFAADQRNLDNIPEYPSPVYNENSDQVLSLDQAKNFLLLLNPEKYETKNHFLDTLKKTNYDMLIIDLFFDADVSLSKDEVISLKEKSGGGKRLVLCYMSIGEAENYRYYWTPGWEFANPVWLEKPNPDWPGNFKVRYWDPGWQAIIYGNDNSYIKRILDAGFDGVYLDIVDAFEYFEE